MSGDTTGGLAATETKGPAVPCALASRVPLAVLCCIFAFLDLDSHAAMAGMGRHFHRAARLLQSSCHDVTLDCRNRSTGIPPALLRQHPRTVRVWRFTHTECIDAVCTWLAAVPCLHTLQLATAPDRDLCTLGRIASLRHLLLDTPTTYTLVTALAGCGPRLRSLHVCGADGVNVIEPVEFSDPFLANGPPGSSTDGAQRTSFDSQLRTCAALESLGFHARSGFQSDIVMMLHYARLPALRTVSLMQESGQSSYLAFLATTTGLTSLCYQIRYPELRLIKCPWPPLPFLRVLDLGFSRFRHDYAAISRAFPLLARLRLVCAKPDQLAVFTQLTDLTVVDVAPSKLKWSSIADQFARVLPLLTRLERLGIKCSLGQFREFECTWMLPHVTHLSLCLSTQHYPIIRAPALRVFRANNVPAQTLLQVMGVSPLLERVDCGGTVPLLDRLLPALGVTQEAQEVRAGVRVLIRPCDRLDLQLRFCDRTFAAADNWL